MVSLLDIVPHQTTVDVGGAVVPIRGLSLTDIAFLIVRHPELKIIFGGKFEVKDIVQRVPEVAVDIIVCGTGHRENSFEDARLVASALPIDQQFDILYAIIDESFKSAGGLGPFVDRVSALLGSVGVPVDGTKDLASSLRKPPKA